MLETLLRAGADPNAADIYGATPLMHAAYMCNGGAVLQLVEAGADAHTTVCLTAEVCGVTARDIWLDADCDGEP